MATYLELAEITNEAGWNDFLNKVRMASAKKAQAVIDSTTPGATVLEWAKNTISNKNQAGDALVDYVIASNSGLTISTILSASDSAIQTNVNAAVDAIYGT